MPTASEVSDFKARLTRSGIRPGDYSDADLARILSDPGLMVWLLENLRQHLVERPLPPYVVRRREIENRKGDLEAGGGVGVARRAGTEAGPLPVPGWCQHWIR
jgi:hypothetical protein